MKEYYGSEPPGGETGWVHSGDGKWVRDESLTTATTTTNIAVIGSGPGGLFTAYVLGMRCPTASVTIFEASDRIGGKIQTDTFSDGTPFEAGVAELYEYKGPSDDPMRKLIEDDLELETINIAGGAVILHDTTLRSLDEVEKVHGLDVRKHIEAFHKKAAELMPLEKYAQRWQPDNSHPWADKTFLECVERELTTTNTTPANTTPTDKGETIDLVAHDYIEASVHSDLATESHTCNGLNGIKNVLMDNDEYMQLYHVVGGISKIVDSLKEKIKAKIRTSTRVTGITKNGENKYTVSSLKVGNRTIKEKSWDFDAVIVCLPNHWLRTIKWEGKLATAVHEVVAHYDLPAHYLRVTILFDAKWWTDMKMPGEFWMMDMCNGCCCYDESTRWGKSGSGRNNDSDIDGEGHILSFLIAGGDALLMCSSNQSDDDIIACILHSLPTSMRQLAQDHFEEARVDRYVGSINAQPGGWPAEELRGEHQPEPEDHPGVYLCGDYFFDSTLNGTLMSANIAVELLLEHLNVTSAPVTDAIKLLEAKDTGV
jgi:monoamine oxidase